VTEEQRSRRPIFIATLWAGASWLFFRVARSTRMTRIRALRSRLEKQPADLRQNTSYFGDRTLEQPSAKLISMKFGRMMKEITWQLIDFHHRIRGFKAVRKVLLNDLHRKLRGQFFGTLPDGRSERKIGRRRDNAIRFDLDDNRSVSGRVALSLSENWHIPENDFKKKSG
jgi:hypothetical protein